MNDDSLLKISSYMVDLYKLARMFKHTNSSCVIEYPDQSDIVTTTKHSTKNRDDMKYYAPLEVYARCIFVNKFV